jgi:hypothetical protein
VTEQLPLRPLLFYGHDSYELDTLVEDGVEIIRLIAKVPQV